ncbi:MAG: hypothetical protein KDK36_03745 [Leptospiraceae bacterium]|nr:hypothetical protein [Leptospiraceae bacterium]
MANVSATLNPQLKTRFDRFVEDNGANQSKIISKAIEEFLNKVEKKELPKKNK